MSGHLLNYFNNINVVFIIFSEAICESCSAWWIFKYFLPNTGSKYQYWNSYQIIYSDIQKNAVQFLIVIYSNIYIVWAEYSPKASRD